MSSLEKEIPRGGKKRWRVHTRARRESCNRLQERAECALLACDVAEWIWREMKAKRRIVEAGTGTPRKKEESDRESLLTLY